MACQGTGHGVDLKFHEVVEGNLIQLKQQVGEILNAKFFIHPINFVGMQRIERDEFPVAAVREMIFNALVHRNYMVAPTSSVACPPTGHTVCGLLYKLQKIISDHLLNFTIIE